MLDASHYMRSIGEQQTVRIKDYPPIIEGLISVIINKDNTDERGHMRAIRQVEIEQLIWQASKSTRKRAILRLHEHEEVVQRMVNAVLPGTYVPPHKHENPDKVELFSILKGQVAVLRFNDIGEIDSVLLLDEHGPIKIVEIPPRTYHSIVALEPSAVLEIIQGPYDVATHKKIADWAPPEDSLKARDYLIYMTSIVENWTAKSLK